MNYFCPQCGDGFQDWGKNCPKCGVALIEKPSKNKFPGALWLLPIFFGVIGGIIAALIASIKYNASWWELLVGGICITIAIGGLYLWLVIGFFAFLGW